MYKDSLGMEQLAAALDNAPVAVFVCDCQNRELLYANRHATDTLMPRAQDTGITCYQALGLERPCPYCRIEQMGERQLLEREFYREQDGRTYHLSGKLINWGGRRAHIEYILDITQQKIAQAQDQALKRRLKETFAHIPCGLGVYRMRGESLSPLMHNPAFFEITGYSPEHIRALEASTTYLGVHPQDMDALKAKLKEAALHNASFQHTYRLQNDHLGAYRWIRLDGQVVPEGGESKLLYAVYTDVSQRLELERELTSANERMQTIVDAIPGGVAIYRVSDIFETVYFSEGVPRLTGYTAQEYRRLVLQDAANLTYPEDTPMVVAKARKVIENRQPATFEFRKQHRDGGIVWVRVQISYIGEDGDLPLLHCVFHNISDLKEAQLEMDHLLSAIPGGIASYRIEGGRFIPTYFSDGLLALSGYTRAEFSRLTENNALDTIYESDRGRVEEAALAAVASGQALDISYRMRHKDGGLIWIHLNGRCLDPEGTNFYAVFTGISEEARLFQSIANETADAIYVIARDNYDLLYVNESKSLFAQGKNPLGQKCYAALHGQDKPCSFCTLHTHQADGQAHEFRIPSSDRVYTTRFRETRWNGMDAYLKYVHDVTDEANVRRDKERLAQYFETVVANLPGGVAVVRYGEDGSMVPEFLSEGFAALTGMSQEDAWTLYRHNAMAGVHPDDQTQVMAQMDAYLQSGAPHCEIVYRLLTGSGGYVWVKNALSLIRDAGGQRRVYSVYHDMTLERAEKERLRRQYDDLIMEHYRAPGPGALLAGHCNISRDRILEISDYTHSQLLETFGSNREGFFRGLSTLIVDPRQRQAFLDSYLREPALAAFARGDREQAMACFIRLPQDAQGRYAQITMNMVATPDSGDVTGILTVTDITEKTISDRILKKLSVAAYDFVADVDLVRDRYSVLYSGEDAHFVPPLSGCHSQWVRHMLSSRIAPKDRARYESCLDPQAMLMRLKKEEDYTFSFSLTDDNGVMLTKNMTVSAIDLRLGRVCLSRSDITDSIREQQGLLSMIACTFELAGLINLSGRRLTMYTRETILKSLPPYIVEDYKASKELLFEDYGIAQQEQETRAQFNVEVMLARLKERPQGYDFLFVQNRAQEPRYKQVNVLWGDASRQTICLVQADVTDMLASERQSQEKLEAALAQAEQANRAKSDFLSNMSHDIRTPMNAIMGMTALAAAHLDQRERVEDCLRKISLSSRHLLSLINDILDMSKIEQAKVTLNRSPVSLPQVLEQLNSMMASQARSAGLEFSMRAQDIGHPDFYGDPLRLNQILINLLSNAIKFTPCGGRVELLAQEVPALNGAGRARYLFTVRDTGIGMPPEFLAHLFEPFSRGARASQTEGTGLGLSITKGLVDLMGGVIRVNSQPDAGSCFQVELECETVEGAPERSRQVRVDAGPDRLFKGRHFLVAEDNQINAEILTGLLELNGASALVRADGAQAVKAFAEAPAGTFDAILMDIRMPRMDGYEATRAIRALERPDAVHIPIIAMTANAFAEDVRSCLEAGMTAHVAKPIDMQVLKSALAAALEGKGDPP